MSRVFIMEPSRWPPEPAADPPAEPEPALSPYEKFKYDISRAWLRTAAPRYWDPQVLDPVETVTTPSWRNPVKGAGPVTAEEIAEYKANEREEFKRQLSERWRNNLYHL
jgi:hypothetical protein